MNGEDLWKGGLAAIFALVAVLWAVFSYSALKWEASFFIQTPANPADFKVQFGIVQEDGNGNISFVRETREIPLRYRETGFAFGIRVVPPDNRPYHYHCVFHYPYAPKVVSGEYFAGKEPSANLETNEISVAGGEMVDENTFDPGDPVGEQSMDVYINGTLVKTFKYTVVPEK